MREETAAKTAVIEDVAVGILRQVVERPGVFGNRRRTVAGRGVSVCAIDGPSGGDWRLKGAPSMKRIKLDLRSRAIVRDFIASERPAVVINCAAFGAYPVQSDPDRIYDVNFNDHREPHLYPQVPSCHLPAVAAALAAERESSAAPPPPMFATIRLRWVAAGAAAPDRA